MGPEGCDGLRRLVQHGLPRGSTDQGHGLVPGIQRKPPTVSEISDFLSRLGEQASISGAEPTDVAGQPAYRVSVSPKHDGGLLGSAELAWDAIRGVPLRLA